MTYKKRILHYLNHRFDLPDEQLEAMLPDFQKTLLGHQEHLEEAYHGSGSLAQVATAAHTMKWAFLSLGLAECAELAIEIERVAAAEEETSPAVLEQIDGLITRIGDIVHCIVSE